MPDLGKQINTIMNDVLIQKDSLLNNDLQKENNNISISTK